MFLMFVVAVVAHKFMGLYVCAGSIIAGQTRVTAMRAVHGHRWREGWGSGCPILLVATVRRGGDRSRMPTGGAEVCTILVIDGVDGSGMLTVVASGMWWAVGPKLLAGISCWLLVID